VIGYQQMVALSGNCKRAGNVEEQQYNRCLGSKRRVSPDWGIHVKHIGISPAC
jgi:hypothetical protein